MSREERRPYVVEEAGVSIAAVELNKTFNIMRTGYIKSLWVRFANATGVALDLTVSIQNHLGHKKPVKTVTLIGGTSNFILFYDSNKGYPLVEHNVATGGVIKDKIVIETSVPDAGNSVDIEIICD